jgi:glyoxylase-like metal-dependent hydrolase (beta-lactamase superfamily II)
VSDVAVTRTRHGPFERISLAAPTGNHESQLSVYRLGALLVDAGGSRVASALVEALRDDPPRRLVLTHHHEDHAGGVAALRRAFGAIPVYAPATHVAYLQRAVALPAYRQMAWGSPEPMPDPIAFEPGAVFEAGGVALETVAAPGHTPGHVAFVARIGGVRHALTGDLYLGKRPIPAWYESAADDLLRSWRMFAAEPTWILPTHGRVREDGERALAEVADWVERHAEQVSHAATRLGSRDPAVVAREVFGPEVDFSVLTAGEFSLAAFARSVLDPVRTLPASQIPIG